MYQLQELNHDRVYGRTVFGLPPQDIRPRNDLVLEGQLEEYVDGAIEGFVDLAELLYRVEECFSLLHAMDVLLQEVSVDGEFLMELMYN
jgi:hypothetical protein